MVSINVLYDCLSDCLSPQSWNLCVKLWIAHVSCASNGWQGSDIARWMHGCYFPLCQAVVNNDTNFPTMVRSVEQPALWPKWYQRASKRGRAREVRPSPFVCYHSLCIPQAPRGNYETRGRLHLPPPRPPHRTPPHPIFPSTPAPQQPSPPTPTPQTFLIISSPK